MYCKYCGKEVDGQAELCVHCGRRLRSTFSATMQKSELTRLRPQRDAKSPGLAAAIGFCLAWIPAIPLGPVGYLYLGQWNWFWITVIIYVIAVPLTLTLAYFLFPFIFAFHQYQMAKELNGMLESPSSGPPESPDSGTGEGNPAAGEPKI
jgi:hypothetical protein